MPRYLTVRAETLAVSVGTAESSEVRDRVLLSNRRDRTRNQNESKQRDNGPCVH
jgi:hypothetical protein